MSDLRILLVGLGNRGTMWGRIIDREPGMEIAGIMDTDPARIQTFLSGRGAIPGFSSLDAALAETRPDAVVLVTPPQGHLEQARLIFEAGVPLLAEKPLTLDLATSLEITRLARAADVPLTVGLNFRYLACTQEMRRLIRENTLGDPSFAVFNYLRNRDWWRPGMNTYPRKMKHPMMLEQSIHHIDLIRHVYGREVEALTCRCWNPPWSVYDHDANVTCQMTLQGGLEVIYTGTWTGGWNELKFQWRTDCPEGMIEQRELFSDLWTARTGDAEASPVTLAPCEPFVDDTAGLLRAFRDALAGRASLPCTGVDHLESLAVCFAAIEAHETGRRVDMAEFRARHALPEPLAA